MKTVLIATAIAIASLSALAGTGQTVSGDIGYSLGYTAAPPQPKETSGSGGSTSALGASAAPRQTAPRLTRAQVRAELDAARRSGQLVSGDLGAGASAR